MDTAEVAAYYRLMIQEPDTSLVSDAQAAIQLDLGYQDFRKKVQQYDDRYYITSADISVTGSSYDLASGAVSILGSSPTNTRMVRLVSIVTTDSGVETDIWQGVSTRRALIGGGNTRDRLFMLEGTTLYFESSLSSNNLTIYYVPISTTVWAGNLGAGAGVYIDDLDQFHELIALYAARRYMIFGATVDPDALQREIDRVETDLEMFFNSMRSVDDRYIQRESYYNEEGY